MNQDNIAMKRLEEDIIYSINRFQDYAEMYPEDRNASVVNILDNLLIEAKKAQVVKTRLNTL